MLPLVTVRTTGPAGVWATVVVVVVVVVVVSVVVELQDDMMIIAAIKEAVRTGQPTSVGSDKSAGKRDSDRRANDAR